MYLLDGNNLFLFLTRGSGPDFFQFEEKIQFRKRFQFHFSADFFFYLPDLGILIPMKKKISGAQGPRRGPGNGGMRENIGKHKEK